MAERGPGWPPASEAGTALSAVHKAANEAAVRALQSSDFIRYERLPLKTNTGANVEVEVVANSYLKTIAASFLLGTGLRASELSSLTARSFDLESDPPTVRIKAKDEKARRGDTLPLPPFLVELLREFLPTNEKDDKLWPGSWAEHKWASKFIKHDLKTAREAWLKTATDEDELAEMTKGGFLCYRNKDGLQADFHSLRHTFLSRLGRSGANAKVMQRLARHSSVVLTIGRYTHSGTHDLQSAVEKLPHLPTNGEKLARTAHATSAHTSAVLPSV